MFALTGGAFAADVAGQEMTSAAAPASRFYAELFGGADLPSKINFVGCCTFDLSTGYAFGGAVGWNTGLGGLAIDLDVLHAHHICTPFPTDYSATTTLMIEAIFNVPLGNVFNVYAGAGIGAVDLISTDGGVVFSAWGAGYQVKAGVGANLFKNMSAFAEYRYQNSFSPISVEGPAQTANSVALFGLKFSSN